MGLFDIIKRSESRKAISTGQATEQAAENKRVADSAITRPVDVQKLKADFFHQLDISLKAIESKYGAMYGYLSSDGQFVSWIAKAERLAEKGKDPSQYLNELITDDSTFGLVQRSSSNLGPLAQLFRDSVLNDIYGSMRLRNLAFWQNRRLVEESFTEQDQSLLSEKLKASYFTFVRSESVQLKRYRERVMKIYDEHRADHNIRDYLKHALTQAQNGNIDRTLEWITKIENHAKGNWDKKTFQVYTIAYRHEFDSEIQKAQKALIKSKWAAGMKHLKNAQAYSNEIGLGLKLDDLMSVKRYLSPKSYAVFEQKIRLDHERYVFATLLKALTKSRE